MLKLKILCPVLVLAVCFILSNQVRVFAHPGNTAADGGHYCRTRCEYWGEVYGQRHFHGGSGAVEEPETPEYEPDAPDYEPDTSNDSESSSTSSPSSTPVSTNLSDSTSKEGCYIATASYGDYQDTDVRYLRSYRDEVLEKSVYGRAFISKYYKYSPYAASVIEKNELLRFVVRETQIRPIVNLLRLAEVSSDQKRY